MSLKQQLLDPANAGNTSWLASKFDEVSTNYNEFLPSKLEAVETLGIWCQRLMRQSMNSKPNSAVELDKIDELIRVSVERWTEGDPAYKGALMRAMKEILLLRAALYEFKRFADLVNFAVSYIRTSPRTTFGVLEVFARSGHDAAHQTFKELEPGFFADAFEILARQSQRGGTVGRCLAALLSDADAQVWYDFTAPHLKESTEQQNVVIYFLEPSLKQSKNPSSAFSTYLRLCKTLNDPSIEIACLKAAKNASLDISEYINGSKMIAQGLKALSKPLRFDALTLICRATRKLTVPVPAETFRLIIDNVPSLFAEGDPQSRADVISCLRHLMLRIITSGKRSPSTDAQEFLGSLLRWSATSLQPGMPYRCLAMATNLLKLLADHGVEVCVPEVTSSLLNCVASDFGDIRESSVELLQKAKNLSLIETNFNDLVAAALNLVSRSRTGDAGARLIEFLSRYQPNARLGEVVVAGIAQALLLAKKDLIVAAKDHSIHGFFIALRVIPHYNTPVLSLVRDAWNACTGPLLVNAPEGANEDILNYCWKAVKESCALVESIALYKPDVIDSTELLIEQLASMLTDITHWGAFSAVPPAYRAVAKLSPHTSSKIIWSELRSLQSKQNQRLVTRRSAGLPLLLTSSLIVQFENDLVELLFSIAEIPFDNDADNEDLNLPQVHGMNCINAFVTDAQLAKVSAPYVERALRLALDRYTSASWSLRNCAAMLFAKLHTRLFGVKGPRMAAGVFFLRFKSMHDILKSEFASKTKHSDLHSMYPALAIVAHLQSSPEDETLDEFWEPIASLLGSKFWKIREMAARALASATQVDAISEAIETLVYRLTLKDQNQTHGISMAINSLLQVGSFKSENDFCQVRLQKLIAHNPCMETNRELYKAWSGVGGQGRLVSFESLPNPTHFNPSIATFEAEQAKKAPTDVIMYANVAWAPVLRALPDSEWTVELSRAVLDLSQLPEIQCRCLQAMQTMKYTTEIGSLAAKLLTPQNAQSVRRQALVLSSKATDLDVDNWLKMIVDLSLDEAAFECRKSATQSIKVFLDGPIGEQNLNSTQRSALFYRLFRLLSDDEEVVRDLAAEVASSFLQIEPRAPAACEPLILSKVSPRYITSQLVRNIGADAEKARATFEDPTDVLFVVEKESLFRDELRNIKLQGEYCDHLVDIPAREKLKGLDWKTPFQAQSSSELLEIRARLEAIQGNT